MSSSPDYWDALAPHHAFIEENYFELATLRLIVGELRDPVLVVGAGQGLIVEALRTRGVRCDGVDLSVEMIRQARQRRNLELIQADARFLPFRDGAYASIIHPSGVIDCIGEMKVIDAILREDRRVVGPSGRLFVAFYRFSAAQERFVAALGMLTDGNLRVREGLEFYRLKPWEALEWVARKARTSKWRASWLLAKTMAGASWSERVQGLQMQRMFRAIEDLDAFITTAPEVQPYRDRARIDELFANLSIPVEFHYATAGCHVVRV